MTLNTDSDSNLDPKPNPRAAARQRKLEDALQAAVRTAVGSVLPVDAPAGCQWSISILPAKAEPSYSLTTFSKTGVYRGAYKGWWANGVKHTVAVAADWQRTVERRGLAAVADAFTLTVKPLKSPAEGVEAVRATVARQGRGYKAVIENRTYARLGTGAWINVEPTDLYPTQAAISRCGNSERRRIMLAIYGLDQYLAQVKAKPVQEDRYGKLYRWQPRLGEEVAVIEVTDATDPSRTYMLRVPPTVQTAHEAVAWTFGMTVEEYNPEVET